MLSHQISQGRFVASVCVTLALMYALMVLPAGAQSRGASSRSRSSSSSSSSPSPQCDKDRDGARSTDPSCGGKDCNDSDPSVNPYAVEASIDLCKDGKDNDCNGHADCSDSSCAGKPAYLPGVFSLEPSGMCCPSESGGQVVDSSNDPKNCGRCGGACSPQQTCVGGRCISGCDLSKTVCYSVPAPFAVPIQRDRNGIFPSQIQALLDGIRENPDCPRPPTREPRFDLKYFSEPLRDLEGKPTDQTIRVLCVTVKF